MRRTIWPVMLCLLLGCPAAEPEPDPEPTPEPAPAGGIVDDVALNLLTLNQGVAVTLMSEGVATERNAVVVAGRPGLLRAYVAPQGGFEERELVAELTLREGEAVTVLRERAQIEQGSLSSDLDTTFNFSLSAEQITPRTRFSVAIREVNGTPAIESQGAAWPIIEGSVEPSEDIEHAYELGSDDLLASDWGGVVRVYIIPVRYDTDGSGRLPDTSEQHLDELRSWMMRLYPVRSVVIEVGEPHPTTLPFDSTSEPMSDLLSEVIGIREQRGIPFDTYAYAMVNPAPSREEYCSSGCTAGIAYRVGNPNADHLRAGVGLGYGDASAAETLAHEVGHNHDRGHAPCGGVSNDDEAYPYPGGGIGVWGWDIELETQYDPAEYADVMGYCQPRWISDYQFDELFTRTAAIEGLASWEGPPAGGEWTLVAVRPGDRSRVKGQVSLRSEPGGDSVRVARLNAAGDEIGLAEGWLVPIADGGPGVATLFVAGVDDDVATLVLPDGTRVSVP